MGISESSFVHPKDFASFIHVCDELVIIKPYAIEVFREIDASDFYLNQPLYTCDEFFVAIGIEV